jgi:hypothetical protein
MRIQIIRCVLAVVIMIAGAASVAEPQWRITSADQKSSLSVGLLVQPQFESLTAVDESDAAKNVFLRRMRIILGGKLTERVAFFIETDSPNVGKADAAGRKNDGTAFIQDAVLTFTVRGSVYLEGGLMIVPTTRHTTQSAATLLGVDYGTFAFSHSDATGSRVGRDYGVQARGYVADKHLEFRAGVFSGARGTGATKPLRYAARAVWYPLEADSGIFYTGTALGAKKIVGVGASVDHQEDYTASSVDLFVDHGGRTPQPHRAVQLRPL